MSTITTRCALLWILGVGLLVVLTPPAIAETYRDVVLADGPIAWYRMADGSDQTGSHTTSVVGAGIAFGQPGPILDDGTGAAQFDGTGNAMMTVEDATDLGFEAECDFSIEVWVKRAASTKTVALVNKGNTYAGFWLRFQGGQIRFLLDYGATSSWNTSVITDGGYADDLWHHVVAVADRDTAIRLYVDGSMVKETPIVAYGTGSVSSTLPFDIGQMNSGSYYDGAMDELAVYREALSDARILAHYRASIVPEPNLPALLAAGASAILLLGAVRNSKRR